MMNPMRLCFLFCLIGILFVIGFTIAVVSYPHQPVTPTKTYTELEKIQFIQSLTREEAVNLIISIRTSCHSDSCSIAIRNAMKQKLEEVQQ